MSGRFFVKQDHQGPPGYAHGGVIAAALDEAMALLVHHEGRHALTGRLEVDLLAPAPVGAFVDVRAWLDVGGGAAPDAGESSASVEGERGGPRADGDVRAGGTCLGVSTPAPAPPPGSAARPRGRW